MKYIFIILICFLGIAAYSQPIQNRANALVTVQDQRLRAPMNLFIPVYNDTTQALSGTNEGIDSTGAIIYTRNDTSFWVRACCPKFWKRIGGGNVGTPGGNLYDIQVNDGAGGFYGDDLLSYNYLTGDITTNNIGQVYLIPEGRVIINALNEPTGFSNLRLPGLTPSTPSRPGSPIGIDAVGDVVKIPVAPQPDTTFTGVLNVIVDSANNSICVLFTDSSTICYPLGSGVTIVGDSLICFPSGDTSLCYDLNNDTLITPGGIDSVTVNGVTLCWYPHDIAPNPICIAIDNSGGVANIVLNSDSTEYVAEDIGNNILFTFPTLLKNLIAGNSNISIRDTTISGNDYVAIYGVGSGSSAWNLTGNSGLDSLVNFIGNTDIQPVIIKVNDIEVGRFGINTGNVSLGSSIANGETSFASNTANANGSNSVAMGSSIANGTLSAAIGFGNVTNEEAAVAFGFLNTANGGASFIAGAQGRANGYSSAAIGRGLVAQSAGGVVVGKFNDTTLASDNDTTIAFAVGIGFSDLARANAMTVFQDGKVAIGGGTAQATLHVVGDGTTTAAFMNGNVGIGTTTPDSAVTNQLGLWSKRGVRFSGLSLSGFDTTTNKPVVVNSSGTLSKMNWPATSSSALPDTLTIFLTGQSNAGVFDTTTGLTHVPTADARIQSWNGTAWVTANPAINNIVGPINGYSSAIGLRNNVALEMGREYLRNKPTGRVRISAYATGATGSWLWTPKTTGPGELSTSNSMLVGLVNQLNAQPAGFNAKVILWQQGEQDVAQFNMTNYLNNLFEIYDTLVAHPQINDSAMMIANYPCSASTYDSLKVAFDSIYYRTKDIGRRNIMIVRHNLGAIDGVHISNDSFYTLGRLDYSQYEQGLSTNVFRPDSTINYLRPAASQTAYYSPLNIIVGGASDPNPTYKIRSYSASVSTDDWLLLKNTSTGTGRQQALRATSTTAAFTIAHNGERPGATVRTMNYINMRDSGSVQISDSAAGEIASFGAASIRFSKPSTFTTNVLATSIQASNMNVYSTTPFIRVIHQSAGTNQMHYYYGPSNSLVGDMACYYNGSTGGEWTLGLGNSGLTAYNEIIRATSVSNIAKVGIGIGSIPLAGLHIRAGTTAANTAAIKFVSGTLNTTIEAGTKEYNNAHYESNNALNRYASGGAIADFTSDANNTSTTETDLYTYTTKASTLAATGEKLTFDVTGTFNDITATGQLQFYFGGTNIGNTGALTVSATGGWSGRVIIIRTGASTARSMVSVTTPGASTAVYTTETDLTGLTFTNTNILKITGTSGGAGGGSSDITAKLGTIFWYGSANN